MKLLTDELKAKLRENNKRRGENHIPVVKFFYPAGAATWIITEMEDDEDTLFGLCDLGFGEPELGYVSLSEIEGANKKMHIPVERDLHWNPTKTILPIRARQSYALECSNRISGNAAGARQIYLTLNGYSKIV